MTTVRGFDKINRRLARLAGDLERTRVLERALVSSAKPMEREYEAGAPLSIRPGVRTRVADERPGKVTVAVGSRHPLAHIFEFGTKRRNTGGAKRDRATGRFVKGTGKTANRGRIIAQGFARRAFDVNVQGWFRNVGKSIWREVKRGSR